MVQSTHEALIDAASALLDDGGPVAVTMREVGRRSNLSHNAAYKHFQGKENLLAAVAARELGAYASVLGPSSETNVRAALERYVERALRHPARFRLVFGRWTVHDAELGRASQAASEAFLALVVAGQRRSELPAGEPLALAELLRATAHGAIELELGGHLAKGGSTTTPTRLVNRLIALLTRDAAPATRARNRTRPPTNRSGAV